MKLYDKYTKNYSFYMKIEQITENELKQIVLQKEQAQYATDMLFLGLKEEYSFLRSVTDELFHILFRKYRLNSGNSVADYRTLVDLLFGLLYENICLDDDNAQQMQILRTLSEFL